MAEPVRDAYGLSFEQSVSYIVARTGQTYGQVVFGTGQTAAREQSQTTDELNRHLDTCPTCTRKGASFEKWCPEGRELLALAYSWGIVALAKGAYVLQQAQDGSAKLVEAVGEA